MAAVKGLANALKGAKNPASFVTALLSMNPNVRNFLQQTSQNGGTYKDAFMSMAKMKGVDPDQFIQQFK